MNVPLPSEMTEKYTPEEIAELAQFSAHRESSLKIAEFSPGDISETSETKRSAWRSRLIEAERGFKIGLRADSTLIVHCFMGLLIVTAGFILGISLLEWTIIVMSLASVLAAEISQHILKTIWNRLGHHFEKSLEKTLRLSTAAVFVVIAGAALNIILIFGKHLFSMFTK